MSAPAQKQEASPQDRLQEVFGLTPALLQDVIMDGLLARTSCTKHHPKTYPGLAQWAETVRALRDKTVTLGWTSTDDRNFPLSLHPDNNVVIAVQTGDRETGTTGIPSNRAPKGANTEDAVAVNQRQLSLFDTLPELPTMDGKSSKIMWVLLYHVAPNEVRFELSLPSQMVGGKIRSWEERLVFQPISLSETDINLGDDDGPEFDVPVERRE